MSPNGALKGRHQFRRRLSLQPSFFRESDEDKPLHHHRSERRLDEEPQTSGAAPAAAAAAASAPALAPAPGAKHRVVVMGAAKVGKTSLISQFLYGTFSPKYKRTVEEMHQGDFSGAGMSLTLDILDTSGAYEFPAMRALSISSADAFILVYDITEASTFDEVRAIREQILETKAGSPAPIVVVGNKLDMAEQCREVDYDTTESVVTVDWENGFVECSAKDNVNVTQVFKELLTQSKVQYNLSPALRKRRRQSLSRHSISGPSGVGGGHGGGHGAGHGHGPGSRSPHIPSPAQLEHLQLIRERHAGAKRNSCALS